MSMDDDFLCREFIVRAARASVLSPSSEALGISVRGNPVRHPRHREERSDAAIHGGEPRKAWIATPPKRLAMTISAWQFWARVRYRPDSGDSR
jgi:hypothetical protein